MKYESRLNHLDECLRVFPVILFSIPSLPASVSPSGKAYSNFEADLNLISHPQSSTLP